jgi:hypothetical protein
VAAQIEGEYAVVLRYCGGEVVPDVCLVSEAVDQQEWDALGAPLEQVKLDAAGTRDAQRAGSHGGDASSPLKNPRRARCAPLSEKGVRGQGAEPQA